MGFTDNTDIFASFHEDGFNRILLHLMQQRPSLFNYATQQIAGNPELLCEVIKTHPIVTKRNNPLITIEDPLPILGTNLGVNFAAQLTDVQLDFHPINKVQLPPELARAEGQSFALRLKLCAGLGCPPDDVVEKFVPPPPEPRDKDKNPNRDDRPKPSEPLVPLPFRRLTCFCLEAFVVGKMVITNYWGKPYLEMKLVNFEIVDIKPEGLESNIECYVKLLLRLSILPKMRFLLEQTVLDIKDSLDNLKKSVFVNIKPTPVSGDVPNNPAIEDDQAKIFVDVEVEV